MNADEFGEQLQEIFSSLFRRGSRYQTEKLAVIAVYLLLSIASLAWAFSGGGLGDNQLGASFGETQIEEIGEQVYFMRNDGSEDWTNVRVVINRRYLYKRDKLEAGSRVTLKSDDFAYFYFIPRAWGLSSWEQLEAKDKPGQFAPSSIRPSFVQLRADQGKLDIDLAAGEGASE